MMDNEKNKEGAYAALTGFRRAVPIILVALSVFISVCFFTQNDTGYFGVAIAGTLTGLFSVGAYFIPVLLAIHAFFYPSDVQKKKLISRIVFSIILLIFISSFVQTIGDWSWSRNPWFDAAFMFESGKELIGGGFVGGGVAFLIISVIGSVGFILLALTIFAVYVTYFLAGENNPARNFFRKVLFTVFSFFAKIEKNVKRSGKDKRERKIEHEVDKKLKEDEKKKSSERKNAKKIAALNEKESDLYDDEFFEVDNGLKEFKISELGIDEARSSADLELNPALQTKVHHKSEVDSETNSEIPYHTKPLNTDYGIDADEANYTVENDGKDYVINDQPVKESIKNRFSYGLDDNAEDVFGAGFVPMNFAENEKIAAKQSTMGPVIPKGESPESIKKAPEKVFSDEDIAAARRRMDFELRKAELKKQREREELERARAAAFTPTSFEFDINPDKAPKDPEPQKAVEDTYASPSYDTPYSFKKEDPEVYTAKSEPVADYSSTYSYSAPKEDEKTVENTHYTTYSSYADTILTDTSYASPTAASFDFGDKSESEDDGPIFTGTPDEPTVNSSLSFDFDDEDEDELADVGAITDEEDDDDEPAIIAPENRNPEIDEYRKMFSVFDSEEDEESSEDTFSPAGDTIFDEDEEEEVPTSDKRPLFSYGDDLNDDDIPPFETSIKAPKTEKPEREFERPDYSNFKFPPIDMLKKGVEDEDPTIEEEIAENGEKLIDSLAQFDVKASIKSVDRGPRITRYEIVPARGVRVQRVISLFDDIALNLAAEGIRMEAPIPGKSAIGVEIPNKHPSTVYLRDLIESDEFMCEPSKTFACFGKDVTGNPIFGDIAKMPHILIAGATGMGKSVCINSILISILYKARPDEVKFIMVDPKTVEFTMYNGIPHLLVPVVTDAKQAAGALMWAIDEMNRRYELMAKHEVRKLDSYNDIVRENPALGEPLPKIIIVIDELNDLMQQVRKPVEGLITNITQKARAAGIHMIIGTQRPSVDVITGVIKANVPSRVSCKVTSLTDSRTILDQAGAEKLLDKGDMLYAPVGKPKPVRVQGAFVADHEVEKIMKFLKSNVSGAIYDEKALEEMTRAAAKCNKGKDSDDEIDEDGGSEEGAGYLGDKQFLEAVDLAIKQGKISTSLIQRKISVGYGKAAKFIDIMEGLGVVSEPNGQKPRDVLVTKTEWQEMLSRRSLDD